MSEDQKSDGPSERNKEDETTNITSVHEEKSSEESEKKFVDCSTITVKMEYENMFRDSSTQAEDELKTSIQIFGQLVPIIVNQSYVLIDGHRRLRACRDLGIKVLVEIRSFKDSAEEKRVIHIYNLNRRHLTDFAKIEAVVNDEEFVRVEAHRRQLSALRQGTETPSVRNQTNGDEKGRSDQICADWAGVSRYAYVKVRDLLKENKLPEAMKVELRSRNMSIKKLRSLFPATKTEPPVFKGQSYIISEQVNLIQGPFRDVDERLIPRDSIDMVFPSVDCSCDKKLTRDIAAFAHRSLRAGGFLVIYARDGSFRTILNAVTKYANDLELIHLLPVVFGSDWINVEDYPTVQTNMALYLIFWKRVELDQYPEPAFGFEDPLAIDPEGADDNADHLIRPREANPHVFDCLVKSLDLAQDMTICDPAAGFGELGRRVVENGLKFIGVEDDPTQFLALMTEMQNQVDNSKQSEDDEEANNGAA